jgi:hypothetical protein
MNWILPPNPSLTLDKVSSSEILECAILEIRNTGGDEIAGARSTYDVKGFAEEEVLQAKSFRWTRPNSRQGKCFPW